MAGTRTKNIGGQRFGRLTAVSVQTVVHGHRQWLFRCDCGRMTIATASNVIRGTTRSCGCYSKDVRRHNRSKICRKCGAMKRPTVKGNICIVCRNARSLKAYYLHKEEHIARNVRYCQQRRASDDTWHESRKQQARAISKRPAVVAKKRADEKRRRSQLAPSYLRSLLIKGLPVKPYTIELPESLLEAKQMHVQIKRLIKEKRNG